MDKGHKKLYRELGITIAYYRRLRGMTQVKLAELCNISRTHLSNIEAPNGTTCVSLNALIDIANALEVRVCQVKCVSYFIFYLVVMKMTTFIILESSHNSCMMEIYRKLLWRYSYEA